jgi:integrase
MSAPVIPELTDYNSVNNWMLGLSQSSKRPYLRHFTLFCEYAGRDPEQLIEWAKSDKTKVHERAKQFFHRLADLSIPMASRVQAYTAIRSFFSHNDQPLGKAPRVLTESTKIRSNRLLKPREICDMLSSVRNIKSKAIISLLVQSGQRVGLFSALRYGHIRKQVERADSPVVVEVSSSITNGRDQGSNKNRTNYRFAFGKESRDYIVQMMNQRRHAGEIIDDSSWLFRSAYRWETNAAGVGAPRWFKPDERGEPPHAWWISRLVIRAAYAAGIQSEKVLINYPDGFPRRFADVHATALRAFWKHQMRLARVVDADLLDFMMGHVVKRYPTVSDVYDAEYVRKEYSRAEPFLTVLSPYSMLERQSQNSPESVETARFPVSRIQRVIREQELNKYLRKGWHYIAVLPTQKIIIQRTVTSG